MTIILTTDELERVTGYKTPKRQGRIGEEFARPHNRRNSISTCKPKEQR